MIQYDYRGLDTMHDVYDDDRDLLKCLIGCP